MLFSQQELAALASLLNRIPLSPPEALWAQQVMERLVAFCQPQPTDTIDEQDNTD